MQAYACCLFADGTAHCFRSVYHIYAYFYKLILRFFREKAINFLIFSNEICIRADIYIANMNGPLIACTNK